MAVSLSRHKIKDKRTGQEYDAAGTISLRPRLARLVPEGAQFEGELTEEGILFRFVGIKSNNPRKAAKASAPAWTRKRGKRKQAAQDEGLLTVALTPDELKLIEERATNGSR